MEKDLSLAVIDIGSNTIRLICAQSCDPDYDSIKIFLRRLFIVRLGQGFDPKGLLIQSAMDRAILALKDINSILLENNLNRIQLVTTGVVREAENRDEFLNRIRMETGMEVKILKGDEEAELTLLGIQTTLPDISPPYLACDIGGGSTELAFVSKDEMVRFYSVPLGAIRLIERFKIKAPLQENIFTELACYIQKQMADVFDTFENVKTFVATAGTATTLASIDMSLNNYDPLKVHGHRLRLSRIKEIFECIANTGLSERRNIVGLESGREDIIIPGIAIIIFILQKIGLDSLIISEGGILEGMLAKKYRQIKGTLPKILV